MMVVITAGLTAVQDDQVTAVSVLADICTPLVFATTTTDCSATANLQGSSSAK